jgi:iron(III) transport system permease protein
VAIVERSAFAIPAAVQLGPRRRVGRHATPQTLIWAAMTIVVAVLVLLPMYHVATSSFTGAQGGSLENYARVFHTPRFLSAIANSLLLATVASLVSMLLGTPIAWLVSRSDMPLRRTIRVLVLASFAVPAFVNALSWVLLAGPNAGTLNKAWMALTGAEHGFIDIFSMTGMLVVYSATIYPLVFIFMSNAFDSMDARMEHAARVLGAGAARVALTITLPLTRPALLAAFIVAFLEALTLYGAPAVIGVPARIYVITTQIWSLFQYPPQIALAAALSMPLLVVTVALLGAQRLLLGRRGFATIQGKAGAVQRTSLGFWQWPASCLCLAVVFVTFLLPNAQLVFEAFYANTYGPLSLRHVTLEHFRYVLVDYIDGPPSIRNSLFTATLAATLAALLALMSAVVVARFRSRATAILGFLCVLPLVVPSMVFAVGLVAAYSSGPLVLYGTLWIMVLAFLTKNLPYAFMTSSTALSAVHVELESVARTLGAPVFRVLRDITVPLVAGGILTGWIVVFANSLRELSAAALLFTSKTTVIATAIMDLDYASNWGGVAALSVILLAINAAVIAVGYGLFGKNVLDPLQRRR